MISATVLKSTLRGQRSLSGTANVLRSSRGLVVTGLHNDPWRVPGARDCWIHTSTCCQNPIKDWRLQHGMPENPNAYGPLTDGPDYSYLDGRPTPIGSGKLKRAKEQLEVTSKILEFNAEMDIIVAAHEAKVKEENERRQNIIQNKLKPKGNIPPEARS